ncbi:MAG: hypothetical protein TU35_000005, partial [Thermoproteus sp. AZ2]
ITLGYHHKRRKIVEGRMAADREVKKALRSLKERHKKRDIRHKAVKLIVTSALRERKSRCPEKVSKENKREDDQRLCCLKISTV